MPLLLSLPQDHAESFLPELQPPHPVRDYLPPVGESLRRGLEFETGSWGLQGDPSVEWFMFLENEHVIFFKISWTTGELNLSLGGVRMPLRRKDAAEGKGLSGLAFDFPLRVF